MNDAQFEVAITEGARADVALDGPADRLPSALLRALDGLSLRVVAPVDGQSPAPGDSQAWIAGCAGLLRADGGASSALLDAARAAGLPTLALDAAQPAGADTVQTFHAAITAHACLRRPYAFFVGRLERDFAQAREALRAAVEAHAGLDLLWVDDGRHATNVVGIRERTRLLIRHARFVLADLTLGTESPQAETPSRAHEIGMAIAYERPLLLCSQEPRRYPYFSIADMQMSFWADERELGSLVGRWLRPRRSSLARQVLNHGLDGAVLAAPVFDYQPSHRFAGPNLLRAFHG